MINYIIKPPTQFHTFIFLHAAALEPQNSHYTHPNNHQLTLIVHLGNNTTYLRVLVLLHLAQLPFCISKDKNYCT